MHNLFTVLVSTLLLFSASAFAAGGEHGSGGQAHRDNTALFPPKMPDHAMATAPASPELITPVFQSKVVGGSTSLTWKASPTASAYHVQVATDPNFKWLKVDEHWVKDTKFDISGLEAGKHYFWRVAPWKDGNKASTNKGTFSTSAFLTE